jgi:hypothetical protein
MKFSSPSVPPSPAMILKFSYNAVNQSDYFSFLGFEILTAADMKSSIFWDITSCSLLKDNRHSEFLLGLSLEPEDGGDIFFRKVG